MAKILDKLKMNTAKINSGRIVGITGNMAIQEREER